jgi:hypothetical protein
MVLTKACGARVVTKTLVLENLLDYERAEDLSDHQSDSSQSFVEGTNFEYSV